MKVKNEGGLQSRKAKAAGERMFIFTSGSPVQYPGRWSLDPPVCHLAQHSRSARRDTLPRLQKTDNRVQLRSSINVTIVDHNAQSGLERIWRDETIGRAVGTTQTGKRLEIIPISLSRGDRQDVLDRSTLTTRHQ